MTDLRMTFTIFNYKNVKCAPPLQWLLFQCVVMYMYYNIYFSCRENPEEYESRIQEMKEKLKPKKQNTPEKPPPQRTEPPPKKEIPGFSGPRTWPPKANLFLIFWPQCN